LHMKADSVLVVDALPDGRADHVRVLGQATLNGKVATRIAEGPWQPETRYTLVSADGGLQGSFAGATAALPFLQPHLSYDTTHAYLTLTRNDTPLDSAIDEPTSNDIGDAVDELTDHTTAPVRNAVLTQNSNGARDLLNVLSGKWVPSVSTRLIEDSRYLRETALNQLNASYPKAQPVWASSYMARAQRAGKGPIPADQRLLRGFALGGTFVVSPQVRATVFAGYEHSTLSQANQNARTTVGTMNLGAAVASRHGLIDLSLGVIRTWHRLSGQREIIGRRLQQWLSSKYRMQALQVFGEAALPLLETTRSTAGSAQPNTHVAAFHQLAWVHMHSPQHREHGGSAALAFKDSRIHTLFSRFGLRAHHEWQDDKRTYRVRGEVAWQHATGNVAPDQQAYFAHASTKRPFQTGSQAIARNALDIKLGLETTGHGGTRINVGYSGRLAQGGTDHGAALDVSWRF
jgi:subtilase-type serine protease